MLYCFVTPCLSNRLLDFINVMTYDFHGAWDPFTGHNSPLYRSSADEGDDIYYNVVSKVITKIQLSYSKKLKKKLTYFWVFLLTGLCYEILERPRSSSWKAHAWFCYIWTHISHIISIEQCWSTNQWTSLCWALHPGRRVLVLLWGAWRFNTWT